MAAALVVAAGARKSCWREAAKGAQRRDVAVGCFGKLRASGSAELAGQEKRSVNGPRLGERSAAVAKTMGSGEALSLGFRFDGSSCGLSVFWASQKSSPPIPPPPRLPLSLSYPANLSKALRFPQGTCLGDRLI